MVGSQKLIFRDCLLMMERYPLAERQGSEFCGVICTCMMHWSAACWTDAVLRPTCRTLFECALCLQRILNIR